MKILTTNFDASKLPPGLTNETLESFLIETWAHNGRVAYRNYLQCGRGMMVWEWNVNCKVMELRVT